MPLSELGRTIRNSILKNRNAATRASWSADGQKVLYLKNLLPVLHPEGVLDVFDEVVIGGEGMPSSVYPSDHLAISASFRLTWELLDGSPGSSPSGKTSAAHTPHASHATPRMYTP